LAASEPAAPASPAAPKYSASDIKTIFSYLDRNKDGTISREEAAGFKGVARNFDRADTNHDGVLSFDEFAFAMNQAR
jgi:Ca2+-binding EF-hand superfamily protein